MDDDKQTAFIGFNKDGQVIFDFYKTTALPTVVIGNNISAATLKKAIDPTTTYMQLIRVPPTTTTGRIGIEVYRNDYKYYEKYINVPKSAYAGTYLLVNGGSATNAWTITKNGTPVLNANTPLGTTVFENRPAI